VGLDVASFPVELGAARFKHHSNKRFARWDLASCPLPRWRLRGGEWAPFDAVLMRDVIQHMPLRVSLRAIRHVATSGARILIATTFPGAAENVNDERPDAFFENNVRLPPFSFPPPMECARQGPGAALCAFDIASLRPVTRGYSRAILQHRWRTRSERERPAGVETAGAGRVWRWARSLIPSYVLRREAVGPSTAMLGNSSRRAAAAAQGREQ